MGVIKCLEANTGYITKEDDKRLEAMALRCYHAESLLVHHKIGGYFVLVSSEEDQHSLTKGKELSHQFADLYVKALEANCTWLVLDRDGGVVEGLELFDW